MIIIIKVIIVLIIHLRMLKRVCNMTRIRAAQAETKVRGGVARLVIRACLSGVSSNPVEDSRYFLILNYQYVLVPGTDSSVSYI